LKWKLISYTEIFVPLPPNKGSYVIGIAENTEGERTLVRIERGDVKNLELDSLGCVTHEEFGDQRIKVFKPHVE
jgi:hypothetical protein